MSLRYDIFVEGFDPGLGGDPVEELRMGFGLAPEAARRFIKALPRVVRRNVPEDEAERALVTLRRIGARAQLRPCPIKPTPMIAVGPSAGGPAPESAPPDLLSSVLPERQASAPITAPPVDTPNRLGTQAGVAPQSSRPQSARPDTPGGLQQRLTAATVRLASTDLWQSGAPEHGDGPTATATKDLRPMPVAPASAHTTVDLATEPKGPVHRPSDPAPEPGAAWGGAPLQLERSVRPRAAGPAGPGVPPTSIDLAVPVVPASACLRPSEPLSESAIPPSTPGLPGSTSERPASQVGLSPYPPPASDPPFEHPSPIPDEASLALPLAALELGHAPAPSVRPASLRAPDPGGAGPGRRGQRRRPQLRHDPIGASSLFPAARTSADPLAFMGFLGVVLGTAAIAWLLL